MVPVIKLAFKNSFIKPKPTFHVLAQLSLHIHCTVAQAVCSINESISGGDAAATLSSLKSAPVGIRSITDDCAATYQEKLAEAKQQKAESGKISH